MTLRTVTSPSADDRPRLCSGGGEDRDLGRRDDRRELGHLEHPEVRERERAVRDLGSPQLPGPRPRDEVAEAGREVIDSPLAAIEQRRGDEALIEGDRDADVDGVDDLGDLAVPDRVERRVLGERERDGTDEERGDGDAASRSRPTLRASTASSSASISTSVLT